MFPPLLFALLLKDYFPFIADTPPIYFNCSIADGFYSGNTSRFHSNLHQLLFDVLYINGKWSGYSNASVGDNPDKVYGAYLCRGDIRLFWCRNFMYEAIKNVFNLCPNYKGAVIWYDECFLQYSSTPLSDIQKEPNFCMPDPEYALDSKGFDEFANRTLETNIRDLDMNWDAVMYNIFAVYENGTPRAFSMVQCEPNILGRHCLNCLNSAAELVFRCSVGRQGGRFFTPRCNLRYSSQSFLAHYTNVIGQGPIDSPSGNETFTHHTKKHNTGTKIALGASMVTSLLIMSLASYVCYRRRIQGGKECWDIQCHKLTGDQFGCDLGCDDLHDQNLEKQPVFPSFPLDLIRAATRNYSEENKLGKGGFGEVYKGTLQDGMEIAVKRLSTSSNQGVEELKNEVTLIAKLQHRNLVKLLGCCLEENESLLIYEYMPNKSLDFFLFDSPKGAQLNWTKRLIIIKGIARGILYLHEDSRHRIVHRDLKASNVLLDLEMNPKISDFGLARIFSGNQSEDNTKRVVGTFGYMAPEYATQGLFSMKSDVFSFGVLLLEIISGKKTSRFHDCRSGHSLISNVCPKLTSFEFSIKQGCFYDTVLWQAWKLWSEGRGLELVDSVLAHSCVGNEVLRCINIGLLCVQYHPADRPNMSSVMFMLASNSVTLPRPMVPTFIVDQPITISPYDAEGVSINDVTITELSPR